MRLVIYQGADAGREVQLERGLLTIGRGVDRDLVLQETQASRSHAELRRFGDSVPALGQLSSRGPDTHAAQWLVVDVGSTNGTFVDGQRLQPQQARPLLPGMEVAIGQTRLTLQEDHGGSALDGREPARITGEPGLAEAVSPAWSAAAWLGRVLVAVGGALLILGALSEWIRVRVQLPLLPIALDRGYGGTDSAQSGLLIAVGAVVILFVLFDVASRRYGFFAGLTQALLGSAIVVAMALQLRRYYEAATHKYLGISLLDVFTQYARDYVTLSVQTGVYFLGAGLAFVILGGLLRLVVGGLDPSGG